MFENLIETKPKKPKTFKTMVLSVFLHALAISAAVYGTLQAKEAIEKPKAEKVEFVEMKKDEPPPPKEEAPPPEVIAAPPPPKGFQVLTAPIKIPDVLPEIDLSKKVTDEADFSGKGVQGGIAKGVVGGTGPVSDQPYFEFQVEKQVQSIPGKGPQLRYPDMLRSANVEGEVLAQFVVDTTGKVEIAGLKILKSSHDLFTNAVRQALGAARYYPAEIGGRKVKQLVQQPFNFTLTR